MAIAAQVIKAGLQRIIVQESEAEIQASEAQDFIFAMNNFMFDLAASGVNLGYTEVNSLDDLITIPTGALRGLITNVAIEVSPDYGGFVSQALVQTAADSLKTMTHLGVNIVTSAYPSTLPRGSGNEGDWAWSDHFYPDLEAEILAESSGAIGLESDTVAA